jgi:hypothetical protein
VSAVADDEKTPEPAAPEWVWMANPALTEEDSGRPPVRFPNDPAVIEHQQARGWDLTEEPRTAPVATAVAPEADADQPPEWVDLVHPDIEGGRNRVPNNAAALEGAYASGWELPQDESGAPADEDQPEPTPAKRKQRASDAQADDKKE